MRQFGIFKMRSTQATEKKPAEKTNTLQAYFISLTGLVLCVTMFFGTTYAWFTSGVTNTGNEIYIGTLDVELEKKNGENWESLSAVTNGINNTKLYTNGVRWEPGYTSLETLRVTDKGELAFDYTLTFTDGKLDGDPAGDWQNVAKWFDVWVYHNLANEIPNPANYAEITADNSGWVYAGTLAEILTGKNVFKGVMEPADVFQKETSHIYTIALHMNGEAVTDDRIGELNALMGKKLELNVKLIATQQRAGQATTNAVAEN